MRIDRANHRKASTDVYQPQINALNKKGFSLEKIREISSNFRFEATTRDESYSFRPSLEIKKSNLGKGHVVTFLCPSCARKCKSLYILNGQLRCRICHGLTYKKVDRRQLRIRKLALNKTMRLAYIESGRWSLIKQAFEAERLYWDTRYHNTA